ncbi:WD40 repeat-like protein [Hypoxylon rubiginosum]|uniref:WD40 repeat-like protein n=1 Tax=Hypoxylon rubiginosum TaxID=110542 RepID=A0ACB9YT55_9PEZI|nr:WD40 repeat-like protein [Hypoxylon rubiginosum]
MVAEDISNMPNMTNPTLLSPPRASNGKERRNPSITPRKFRRFFTPRSRVPSRISSARKALKDLAAPDLNNRYQTPAPSSPLLPSTYSDETVPDENLPDSPTTRRPKRRKFHHTPDSSPCRPSVSFNLTPSTDTRSATRSALLSPIRSLPPSQEKIDSDSDESDDEMELPPQSVPLKRITPLTSRGLAGQLMQRELGGIPRRSYMSFPTTDWRIDAAGFYSRPDDVHECISHEGGGRCIPFCTATCNTNSLTAVGDEEGRIRLLDSASGRLEEPFNKIHLCFQAHSNAIIDLTFSDDDLLLATASGDQTGRVIDMMTQTPVAILQHHTASLKQVRFQPGQANKSVLATSSRDGSVQIWDLRCTGRPVSSIAPLTARDNSLRFRYAPPKQGCSVNSLYHAHAHTSRQVQQIPVGTPGDTPSRRELPGRINNVSVTALQFLPEGKEHLLLTGCEADACIKLWDIRAIHSSRQKVPSPLSVTAPPSSHQHWRSFGVSSLALGTDASRLYALCKDNTVYAYSTAHLILGHAPELSTRNGEAPRRRHNAVPHQGLGPLYGFRHPSFFVTSFYVKCAVRPARNGRSELLAVGSSNSTPVLFPTEERYFRNNLTDAMSSMTLENSTIATSQQPASEADLPQGAPRAPTTHQRLKDDIPIVKTGTPLIRGHEEHEVGAVTWTNEGKLITSGDDYLIRCWSEGKEQAADLRTGGETGGRRWGCGWADVAEDFDEADDDED